MIIPYRADVPMARRPVANHLIIAVACVVYALQVWCGPEAWRRFVLTSLEPVGLFGSMWLHANVFHLAGNMVFLWVFGNAVCSKLGNGKYVLAYIGLGLAGDACHLALDGCPSLGASGAISGVVGLYLILYPFNKVSCVWVFSIFYVKSFKVGGLWLIAFRALFDVAGVWLGLGGVAYWAHLGGTAAGAALGLVLLLGRWVKMESYEESLLQFLEIQEKAPVPDLDSWWSDNCPATRLDRVMAVRPKRASTYPRPRLAASRERARAASARSPRAGGGPRLSQRCRCGWEVRVPLSLVGTKTRCPICSNVMEIRMPGEAGAGRARQVKARRGARRASFEPRGPACPERPVTRSRSRAASTLAPAGAASASRAHPG